MLLNTQLLQHCGGCWHLRSRLWSQCQTFAGVSTEQQGHYESSQLSRGAKIQDKIWTLKSNNFYLTSPVWNTPPDHQSSWSTHHACHQRVVVLPLPLQAVTQSDSWAVHSRRWVPTTATILLSTATAKRHQSTLFIWYGPAGEVIHAVAYNGGYTLTWWLSSDRFTTPVIHSNQVLCTFWHQESVLPLGCVARGYHDR